MKISDVNAAVKSSANTNPWTEEHVALAKALLGDVGTFTVKSTGEVRPQVSPAQFVTLVRYMANENISTFSELRETLGMSANTFLFNAVDKLAKVNAAKALATMAGEDATESQLNLLDGLYALATQRGNTVLANRIDLVKVNAVPSSLQFMLNSDPDVAAKVWMDRAKVSSVIDYAKKTLAVGQSSVWDLVNSEVTDSEDFTAVGEAISTVEEDDEF